MQQQKHSWQARQTLPRGPALLVLLDAAALLAMLIVAGWGSARAAPQSGAPSITIFSIAGNTLNLQFAGWTLNQTVTLSYSTNTACSASQPLPNAAFSIIADPFDATYTWPTSGIAPGTYYLCGTGPVDGTVASPQTVTVTGNGAVQSTPGVPGATPTATTTRSGTPTTPTSGSPGPSATTAPGTTGTPVTNGQGASPPSSNTDASTLVAIILLCLLVLALLAYLIRIWLQGRQASGSPPGGGQQKP
jgi:archaellum component FlaG (FlaF/FlaG flagellin family)